MSVTEIQSPISQIPSSQSFNGVTSVRLPRTSSSSSAVFTSLGDLSRVDEISGRAHRWPQFHEQANDTTNVSLSSNFPKTHVSIIYHRSKSSRQLGMVSWPRRQRDGEAARARRNSTFHGSRSGILYVYPVFSIYQQHHDLPCPM